MPFQFTNPCTNDVYEVGDFRSCSMKLVKKGVVPLTGFSLQYEELGKRCKPFLPPMQAACIAESLTGEESEYFVKTLTTLANRWEAMPSIDDEQEYPTKAYMKFFCGAHTYWMCAKPTDTNPRAFGFIHKGIDQEAEFAYFMFHVVDDCPELCIMSMPTLNVDHHFEPIVIPPKTDRCQVLQLLQKQ